jgi:DNA-binding transcriptional ArsR family regulator
MSFTTSDEVSAGGCEGLGAAAPVADLTTVLAALADPVRIAIVRSLAETDGPRACGSFYLPVTKSTLSHHFRVLREAGLIEQRCEGTRKLTSLRRADVDAAYPGLLDSVLRAVTAEERTLHGVPATD